MHISVSFPRENAMSKDQLTATIASIKQDLGNIHELLSEIKHETGMLMAGLPCDFLPFEILRACGIHPFVIPPGFGHYLEFQAMADVIIASARCCALAAGNHAIQKITVAEIPADYGDSSLSSWKTLIGDVLAEIKGKAVEIPHAALRASAEQYSSIRRLVRGINLLRREKNDALSNEELSIIFSAALALPPEMMVPKLSMILDALNECTSKSRGTGIPTLVYGQCRTDGKLFDNLEQVGFLIAEDDTCGGRRSFDLSYNTSAEYLFDEIINAFSFRPFCPCLRGAASRFELLYMLAGSYGIETVIFIDDETCPARTSHIEFMRPRLMRLGIDPLLLHPENPLEEARRYVKLASR